MADAIYLLQNVTHSILFWIQNFTSGLNRSNGRYFFSNTVFNAAASSKSQFKAYG